MNPNVFYHHKRSEKHIEKVNELNKRIKSGEGPDFTYDTSQELKC